MVISQSLFDTAMLAQQYGLSAETLERLLKQARSEFGGDEMMVELHVVRAIRRTRFDEIKKAVQS